MFGNEILIVLGLLGLGAVATIFVLRSRSTALPPAPREGKALGESPRAPRDRSEAPDTTDREDASDDAVAADDDASDDASKVASDDEAEAASDDAAEADDDDESEAASDDAAEADDESEADDDDASDGSAAEALAPDSPDLPRDEAEAEPSDDDASGDEPSAPAPEPEPPAASPRPTPMRFVPPPRPGTRARTATPAPAVPLPVDKPKLATSDQDPRARREQERERYRQGLAKTRRGFVAKLARLFKGKPKVDEDLHDRIEEVLFTADIGTHTAQKLLDRVTRVLDKKEVADPDAVWAVIRQATLELLEIEAPAPDYAPDPGPYVLLMIGVNGVGKTTTLGKLAAQHRQAGRKVLLVAGDTFRAAAVEQLDVWARRVGCTLHSGSDKADPSSVIFDGIARARREGFDVVLCDTAGRLHTRKELMDELAKVGRAAAKALARGRAGDTAPASAHDIFLVLDATIGQNALAQAQLFKQTMGFTGLVVTKLDGTAKGGVVLGICDELRIPIRYIGVGEGVDDLRAFDAEDFADALLMGRDTEAAPS